MKVTAPEHVGPSMVQQHFKDECDINRIVKKYTETGLVTHVASSPGEYGISDGTSFTEAMFLVTQAQEQFDQLPSEVRAHFNNDPADFLDAAHDDERYDEFVDLGLVMPREEETPVQVEVINREPNAAPEAPQA